MTATAAKKGLRFEVKVAAELKTKEQNYQGKALNLTSYNFFVTPFRYSKEITQMGIEVTLDIKAQYNDIVYLVECKSTKDQNAVLTINNSEFIKSIVEFICLENIRKKSDWNEYYLLVTNYRISKELFDLFSTKHEFLLKKLYKNVRTFFEKKDIEINYDIINEDFLKQTLNRLSTVQLNDQYLDYREINDEDFIYWCNQYETQKKYDPISYVPNSNISLLHDYIIFNCNAISHDHCIDINVKNVVCHFGNCDELLKKIINIKNIENFKYCYLCKSTTLGFNISSIEYDINISHFELSELLSEGINKIISLNNYDKNLYLMFIPGSMDILITNKNKLAKKIYDVYNKENDIYDLNKIDELKKYGDYVKKYVAKKIMELEFGLIIDFK